MSETSIAEALRIAHIAALAGSDQNVSELQDLLRGPLDNVPPGMMMEDAKRVMRPLVALGGSIKHLEGAADALSRLENLGNLLAAHVEYGQSLPEGENPLDTLDELSETTYALLGTLIDGLTVLRKFAREGYPG